MTRIIGRRRAIAIIGATIGLPLLPLPGAARAALRPVTWSGQALGASATLILNHEDEAVARRLLDRVVVEIDRLEAIFSLYRSDSALSVLNRMGALVAPPAELVHLLEICASFHKMTGGAFDPTVQPLWTLYADHFAKPSSDQRGPSARAIRQALAYVDLTRVRFSGDRIAFAMPDMALTLNGIAQGYITDRIVDLLRQNGVASSLVHMGESRTIGARADGSRWQVGLAVSDVDAAADIVLPLVDRAVATSGIAGFSFDEAGRLSHILDPRTGLTMQSYRRVSVIADDAVTADALSTAFSLMEPQEIKALIDTRTDLGADLLSQAGTRRCFGLGA